jgi:uncharacterized membrane protein YuzA (DUF378 family)
MEIKFSDLVQIIVALIGLAGVIYSVRYQMYPKKQKETSPPNVSPSRQITVISWISFILLAVNFGIFGFRYWINSPTVIEITYPVKNESVNINETIRGVSRNIKLEKNIWVIIYSNVDRVYYPNRSSANIGADGAWTSPSTMIGSSNDVNKKFDIIAFLVDRNAKKELQEYFHRSEEKKIGLNKIPEGATEYHRISVIRR